MLTEVVSRFVPYRVTLVLSSIAVAAFLAATAIGFYFGSFVVAALGIVLAALNLARFIFLIRIGKAGWESRARQGR